MLQIALSTMRRIAGTHQMVVGGAGVEDGGGRQGLEQQYIGTTLLVRSNQDQECSRCDTTGQLAASAASADATVVEVSHDGIEVLGSVLEPSDCSSGKRVCVLPTRLCSWRV